MSEKQQLLHLQRGLKPSLAQMTIPFDPQTCLELLEQAKGLEAAAAMIEASIPPNTTRPATEDMPDEVAAIQPAFQYRPQHPPTHQQYSTQYGQQLPDHQGFSGYDRGPYHQQQHERSSRNQTSTQWFSPLPQQSYPDYYSSAIRCYSCDNIDHFARECRSGRRNYYPKV
ncbi:unnamed protein product [Rotaria sp. Silwood1]|nr:unnamed protein product [Rotaria sp. Silwood1]CAF5079215.1 unnamed protein product [Rotaria sp. Silwood1]